MFAYVLTMSMLLIGLVILSSVEWLWPLRPQTRRGRWVNIVLGAISRVVTRAVLPIGLGAFAMHWHYGLLHILHLNPAVTVVLGVLLLDLVKYSQHILFHYVHFFWRFHRVHHSDLDLDATTALRFHPGQALISVGISFVAVMALGLPMLSILAFSLLHEAVLLITHTNLNFPKNLDGLIRFVFVSPRMHWIHHSAVAPRELDHNYGICFSFWDRLFGTYLPRSRVGDYFPFGIEGQPDQSISLTQLLILPLRWRSS